MTTFYLGQRVRIVGHTEASSSRNYEVHGMEAVVVRIGTDTDMPDVFADYLVRLDNAHEWSCMSDELEPIQPEGYQVVTWESCLWQPERETA